LSAVLVVGAVVVLVASIDDVPTVAVILALLAALIFVMIGAAPDASFPHALRTHGLISPSTRKEGGSLRGKGQGGSSNGGEALFALVWWCFGWAGNRA